VIHFAASISDRGDDGFDHFTEIAERRRATRLRPADRGWTFRVGWPRLGGEVPT
jgi:hypothetical protein